jgi:hypothetical protein
MVLFLEGRVRRGWSGVFGELSKALAFCEARNESPSSDRGGRQGGVRRSDAGFVLSFVEVVRTTVPSMVMKRTEVYGLLD